MKDLFDKKIFVTIVIALVISAVIVKSMDKFVMPKVGMA